MAKLDAPKNQTVSVAKLVLDSLIAGAGVEATIAAASAAVPFLNAPIVRTFFRWGVEQLAELINENLFKWAAKMIIRVQRTARRDEFNEAMLPIIEGVASDDELQRARDAAAGVINRGSN